MQSAQQYEQVVLKVVGESLTKRWNLSNVEEKTGGLVLYWIEPYIDFDWQLISMFDSLSSHLSC